MIGAKTVGSGVVLCIALLLALGAGLFRPERLLSLQLDAALVIGALGVLVGGLVYRFWRLHERSEHYFRLSRERSIWADESTFLGRRRLQLILGENDGAAFDLPRGAQLGICLALGILLGLGSIEARALSLLFGFPRQLTAAGSTWCPEEKAPDASVSAADPSVPGCALIRRAFELGYTRDLGRCAPQENAERAQAQVCTLRQRDEPALHYGMRRLEAFAAGTRQLLRSGSWTQARRDFTARLSRLDRLYEGQRQVMASVPHASHHLWTTLPDPGAAFEERTCADRYRLLSFRPAQEGHPGKLLEHILGQLLFEARYEPAAGYCREYKVHWGAPRDACARLAANPEAFLRETGALSHVRSVLARHDLQRSRDPGEARALEAQAFLSFHCLVEGGPAIREEGLFELDGRKLLAAQVGIPAARARGLHVELYHRVSSLLAPTFQYGALLSEVGLTSQDAAAGVAEAFSAPDFLLTRAHALRNVDLFLDPEPLAERNDLLEIYPYHLHFRNYVKLFRGQYKLTRGRL